jgi:hypothetical protein
MNKIVIAILVLLISSCSGINNIKGNRVHSGINDYLYEHLNDYNSYESVSFSEVDSLYDIPFNNLLSSITSDTFNIHDVNNLYKFSGYQITHKFRATNEFGALVLYEEVFILDTNFAVIEVY